MSTGLLTLQYITPFHITEFGMVIITINVGCVKLISIMKSSTRTTTRSSSVNRVQSYQTNIISQSPLSLTIRSNLILTIAKEHYVS